MEQDDSKEESVRIEWAVSVDVDPAVRARLKEASFSSPVERKTSIEAIQGEKLLSETWNWWWHSYKGRDSCASWKGFTVPKAFPSTSHRRCLDFSIDLSQHLIRVSNTFVDEIADSRSYLDAGWRYLTLIYRCFTISQSNRRQAEQMTLTTADSINAIRTRLVISWLWRGF
jgi:hypothetical protein